MKVEAGYQDAAPDELLLLRQHLSDAESRNNILQGQLDESSRTCDGKKTEVSILKSLSLSVH